MLPSSARRCKLKKKEIYITQFSISLSHEFPSLGNVTKIVTPTLSNAEIVNI